MGASQYRSPSPHSIFICATLFAFQYTPAFATRPVIAIFDVEDRGAKLSQSGLDNLANYISARLSQSGRFEIVPRSEIQTALLSEKSRSYKECYDERCQIEIGKELAAEKTLATRIARFGKSCMVTIQLFDLKKSTAEAGRTERGPCEEEAILRSLEKALSAIAVSNKASSAKLFRPGPLRSPEGPAPIASSKELKVKGETFGKVDIAALETYDAAAKGDKNQNLTAADKIALWKKVLEVAPQYAATANERIAVWERFASADKNNARFRTQRKQDWEKLERLLKLTVIPRKDKVVWVTSFLEAYSADAKTNPFMKEPALKPFLEEAEFSVLENKVEQTSTKEARRALIKAFLARYPRNKAAIVLRRAQHRKVFGP